MQAAEKKDQEAMSPEWLGWWSLSEPHRLRKDKQMVYENAC